MAPRVPATPPPPAAHPSTDKRRPRRWPGRGPGRPRPAPLPAGSWRSWPACRLQLGMRPLQTTKSPRWRTRLERTRPGARHQRPVTRLRIVPASLSARSMERRPFVQEVPDRFPALPLAEGSIDPGVSRVSQIDALAHWARMRRGSNGYARPTTAISARGQIVLGGFGHW